MVENKRFLYLAFIFLFSMMVMNIPYPHYYPLGEIIFNYLHIPIRFGSEFHTVGMLMAVFLLIGLYFLVKSVNRYHFRVVLIAIFIVAVVPGFIVNAYQKTFATGIYAISYLEGSYCNYEYTNKIMYGECELYFQNHSNDDVQFTVVFNEEHLFEEEFPTVSLMNEDAPYEVLLKAKETKSIKIESVVEMKDMGIESGGGGAWMMNIIITSNGKIRYL